MIVTVRLVKPTSNRIITYPGEVLQQSDDYRLVRTVWTTEMGRVDLGYVVFEPGDYLYEHFYGDRWYNVFELHAADGRLKGWYCNITRPAIFTTESITSEDLELDLFISPRRDSILVLDEDEYAARGLEQSEPATHAAARAALDHLQEQAQHGYGPFCPVEGHE